MFGPGEYSGWLGKALQSADNLHCKKVQQRQSVLEEMHGPRIVLRIGRFRKKRVSLDVMRRRVALTKQFDEIRKLRNQSLEVGPDPFRDRAIAMVTSGKNKICS